MGTHELPLREDGYGVAQETPPEFDPRQLETPEVLPRPVGNTFESKLGPIPEEVLVRSSWVPECPVTLEELAYITVSHHGFEGEIHTGEMIVNAAEAVRIPELSEAL